MANAIAKPRRWMALALAVSVGLNLAVLGFAAGAFLKGPKPGGAAGPSIGRYARALPEPYDRDLRRALRASRGEWSGQRAALDGQRRALARALARDPFDPAEIGAILAREDALSGDLAARGARLLTDQIGRMTPEERAEYARALLAPRRQK